MIQFLKASNIGRKFDKGNYEYIQEAVLCCLSFFIKS